MRSRAVSKVVSVMFALLFLAGIAAAQQVSGSMSGVVQDAQGAVVPNAKVTLINQTQGVTAMTATTGAEGTFVFTPLLPATYTVTVEAAGFKKYSKTEIVLFANDRMGLPPISLEVGSATESVTVEANAVTLETVTAARSGIVTDSQVKDIALNGRSFTNLMKTVPGVTNDGTNAIGGQRTDQYTYTLDGVTMEDSGCGCFAFRYSVDAIAEVKVQTNALTAEFGHSAGPQVTVVSKGGTRDFHGSGFWFHRNEGMNANSWLNNVNGQARSIYRYTTAGWNLGGPFYIPGKLNKNRDKLFFFAQQEWNHSLSPAATQQLTMPTDLERQGNFSQSHNASGVIQTVKDPTTGNPFPNNIIPQDRWNSYGAAILNWMPKPNVAGFNNYNWFSSVPTKAPQFDEVYRADYNISDKWRFTFRLIRSHSLVQNPYTALASNNQYGYSTNSPTGAWGVNANLSTIISPTLTNEFVYGNTRNYLPVDPPDSSSVLLRSVSKGMAIPLLYPSADPAGIVPNLAFGGIPQSTGLLTSIGTTSAYSTYQGLPYANQNPTINITDNITKITGTHILKAGIFFETVTKTQSPYADVNGTLIFDQDSQNPGDTGWAFANALLGNYRAFTQMSKYEVANYKYNQTEWYVQDTWKVKPTLTLNYGVRFSLMGPLYETGDLVSGFVPSAYSTQNAVTLWQPTLVNGVRMALNPVTGATAGSAFIGAIASGDINNGMVQQNHGVPNGLTKSRGPQFGPRFGFAWTPGGADSKTVVRGGVGVFFERIQGNYLFYQITNPPVLRESQLWYGNISNIATAQQTYFPVSAGGVAGDGHLPTVYNYNLGLQRQLPFGILMDTSYVGSISRHQTQVRPFNDAPFGSAWQPQNQDPSKCPNISTCNLNGDNALPVSFYRPYIGYLGPGANAGGTLYEFGGTANYNALQASFNRRMSKTLQLGVAYTWSKALGIQSSTTTNLPIYQDLRKGMYGPLSFDRTQSLTFNYVYNVPGGARKGSFLDNPAGRLILNGWQLSGITSITSGNPGNITYSYQSGGSTISGAQLNRQVTGSEDVAPRVVFTCNPMSGGGQTLAFYNSSCLAPAAKGSQGIDSGWDRLRGPGYNNWDVSVYKKIMLPGEKDSRYIQLRAELYNAPNHTEFGSTTAQNLGIQSTAIFNAAGQITNLPTALGGSGGRFGFGALNSVRTNSQRIIQIAAKIYF